MLLSQANLNFNYRQIKKKAASNLTLPYCDKDLIKGQYLPIPGAEYPNRRRGARV